MIQVDLNLTLYGLKMDDNKPDMIKMVAVNVFVSPAVFTLWSSSGLLTSD